LCPACNIRIHASIVAVLSCENVPLAIKFLHWFVLQPYAEKDAEATAASEKEADAKKAAAEAADKTQKKV
jgi:hypothetical protein